MALCDITDDEALMDLLLLTSISNIQCTGNQVSDLVHCVQSVQSAWSVNRAWHRSSRRVYEGMLCVRSEMAKSYDDAVASFLKLMNRYRAEMLELARIRWTMGLAALKFAESANPHRQFRQTDPALLFSILFTLKKRHDIQFSGRLWPEEVVVGGLPLDDEVEASLKWIRDADDVLTDKDRRDEIKLMLPTLAEQDAWNAPWDAPHEVDRLYKEGRLGMPSRAPLVMTFATQLMFKLEYITFWATLFKMMLNNARWAPMGIASKVEVKQLLGDTEYNREKFKGTELYDFSTDFRNRILDATISRKKDDSEDDVFDLLVANRLQSDEKMRNLRSVTKKKGLNSFHENNSNEDDNLMSQMLYRSRCTWLEFTHPRNAALYESVTKRFPFKEGPAADKLRAWAAVCLES